MPNNSTDDRAADLIVAWRAGERGDADALVDIEDRGVAGAIVIGHACCALSGAVIGFCAGVML